MDYDLLIIGSGGAGMAAAIRASELGARAAIVEAADVVGGTCVNVGCIPSKHLIEAAHHFHTARSRYPAGIGACSPTLVWREVLLAKRTVVERLRQEKYLDVLEAYQNITLLRGRAVLESGAAQDDVAIRVRVGQELVRARKVIIATGTAPAMPPIPGLREIGALDSTTAMVLPELPASLLVVGGGSIGLELGQAFARFGVRVVVLELEDRILSTGDRDVSAALAAALEAEGLEIRTGVRVTQAARRGSEVVLTVERAGMSGEVHAEQVLVATGRQPNTADLGLEAANVRMDRRGFISTDEFMRTSHPAIYAAGDVTGGPGYVYVAALQGGIAAQAALAARTNEGPIPIDLTATPAVTFTDPQVATVGLTEAEARKAGYDPRVTTLPVAALSRAAVSYRQRGLIKLVADTASDRLLGAHLVAPNAGDVIGEAALAIRFTLTAQNLVSTLHPYLTWGEGLKLAARTFTKDVALLSCCA
ncbi:MAG: mercury(II) reductase [Gemmatimonadota bacterium]|nr:mercury(II) reductase [Gemmatimonadota bacterium]